MKNYRWQGIAFFLLIFILTIGLSYLAFNENTTEHENKEKKMAIALVNEDEGTIFNDDKIVFGNEFANSINKDSKHDWYVVSRGVAESGFNRDAYDMMIVIPNDFSERSLSIHLDRPEPVSLHYKINASGHEDVRAEAEKTAEKILNDFNTRLIDVYFASIIGNLQEAQDNINEIIHKEKEYTQEYNNQINLPLTNYTAQFKTVQDYTEISKESYQGLESVLEMFETNLLEDVTNNQTFLSEIDTVMRSKEESSNITNTFSEIFDQFVQNMNRGDVLQQLAQLEQENELVHREFQQDEESTIPTLVSKATLIEKRFESMVDKINKLEDDLHNKFGPELEAVIKKGLETDFDDVDVGIIKDLFEALDENIQTEIKGHITELPSLNEGDFIDLGLAENTVKDITNVIHVTKRFNQDFNNNNLELSSSKPAKGIKDMKQYLVESGITVKDHIDYLPAYGKGEEQFFYIEIPNNFSLDSLSINGEKHNYNKNGVKLVNPSKGNFTVEAHLKLKNVNEEIDVSAPISWNWKVFQEGMEDQLIEKTKPSKPNKPSNNDEYKTAELDNSESPEIENNPSEKNTDNADESAGNKSLDSGNNNSSKAGEVSDDSMLGNENGTLSDNSKTIIRTNNYLYQKVESSLITESTEELIGETVEMVSDYYKLHSLYELYFGFDMNNVDLGDNKLSDLATSDSLYHFIHKKEIKDILKDNIAKKVMNIIAEDLQKSLTFIEEQIGSYTELVNNASGDSTSLVNKITETKDHANNLNQEVASILTELANWRDASNELANEKVVVLGSDQDVQTAIMNLDSGYQPLLMASESLALQASASFDSADHVYQTFESIHQQAGTIQESGVNLVAHANDLANKLTEKAVADANFADNFNEVLANSRVGERQNENLYRFLANPVQTKNEGIITKGESFTPYFLVIILSVVTLFTAYVISSMNDRRVTSSVFEQENSLIKTNRAVTAITASIGLIEGLAIGLISFYLLNFSQGEIYVWLGLIILLTMFLLLVSTYLLRQLKMVGMFLLLVILSLYLLLTRSLRFHFENSNLVEVLRKISPLQYGENLLTNVIEGKDSGLLLMLVILVVMTGVGFLLNLVVFQKTAGEKEMEDESAAEAN